MTVSYKKTAVLIALILAISGCGPGGLPRQGSPTEPNYYTYSIQYGIGDDNKPNNKPKGILTKIDIRNDEIVDEVDIDAGYNDLSIEPDGNVIITMHRPGVKYGQTVSRYYPKQGKIKFLFNTKAKGITKTFVAKNKLFITMYLFNPQNNGSGIEIYDIGTLKHERDIYFGDGERVYTTIFMGRNKEKLYAASYSIENRETEYIGKVFVVDTTKGKIEKTINLNNLCGGVSSITLGADNKLYLAATFKVPGPKKDLQQELNNQLFVFSTKDFKLLEKMPIGVVADSLVYVKALNRLYVSHSSWGDEAPPWIEVIDCTTDKVIGKIKGVWGIRIMSYVGNYKMYVTVNGRRSSFGTGAQPGILVIDLKTNQIIKKIPGNYAPISINLDPLDEITSAPTSSTSPARQLSP